MVSLSELWTWPVIADRLAIGLQLLAASYVILNMRLRLWGCTVLVYEGLPGPELGSSCTVKI